MTAESHLLLCVGGIDPTGGAGLLRDAWTVSRRAPELRCEYVVSAWTWQGRGRPARARGLAPKVLERELDRASRSLGPLYVKLGLLSAETTEVVADWLRRREPRAVVLDPVLNASDGGSLGAEPEGLRALFPLVSLVTPNRHERLALGLGEPAPGMSPLPCPLLAKGVDAREGRVCDTLVDGLELVHFDRARVPGQDPRGTGCALATAIACALARGAAVADACGQAIAWLDHARIQARVGPDGRPHLRS